MALGTQNVASPVEVSKRFRDFFIKVGVSKRLSVVAISGSSAAEDVTRIPVNHQLSLTCACAAKGVGVKGGVSTAVEPPLGAFIGAEFKHVSKSFFTLAVGLLHPHDIAWAEDPSPAPFGVAVVHDRVEVPRAHDGVTVVALFFIIAM